MKKSLIVTSLLLAAIAADARTLTPEEALRRLDTAGAPMKAASSVAASPRLVHTTLTTAGAPAVYLFDRADGGYMLLGADDLAQPLLGYSDSPVADGDEMPPQMLWWLEQYAAEIEQAKSDGVMPCSYVSVASRAASMPDPVAPLCTTKWSQDAPYNTLCPTISGSKAMTGCVATALAQVMKYHNWPERGTGSITYDDSNGTRRSMSFNVTFDWDNMLDSYTGVTTSTQKNAVGLLMKACGFGVRMNYGVYESGASEVYVVPALLNYFNYDGGARLCQRENYGLADWQQMIYDNLVDVGPVLYCGSSHLGGHCFVCDGYSTDGYFHFNWGWEGNYDGYYLLTALNPEGQGIGGYAGGYNLLQSVVLGIQKPTGSEASVPSQLEQQKIPTGSVSGTDLYLKGIWANMSGRDLNLRVAAKVVPVGAAGGGERYIELADGAQALPVNRSFTQLSFPVGTLADGTYQVSVVTKSASAGASDPWLPVLHPINHPGYVVLTRAGQGFTVSPSETVNLKVTSAELLTSLYYGCSAKLKFSVTNTSNVEVAQSIAPGLLSSGTLVAIGGGEFVDLLPGETKDCELTFEFAYSDAFKTNTFYSFVLYESQSGYLFHNFGMKKVLPNPGATLSAVSFSVDGNSAAVNRDNIVFRATVKCLSGYFAAPLMVIITEENGGEALVQGSSEALFLNVGEKAETQFNMSFSGAEAGKTYTAFLGYADGYNFEQLRYLDLTIDASGVEAVTAQASGIELTYDSTTATAHVEAGSGIADVEVFNAAGNRVRAFAGLAGQSAYVDLSGLSQGVALLNVRTVSGAARTFKICR